MCGVLITGFDMAAELTYIGRTLYGGDRTPHGQTSKTKSGSSHSGVYALNRGGGYRFGTKA